jgi:holo-[acyl-carrier protein] synthase
MILGVGVDTVDNERFARALERHGQRFLEKIFTGRELDEGQSQSRSVVGWAARFAAKEAVFKALRFSGFMAWHQIEVLKGELPFPRVEMGDHYLPHLSRHEPWRFHLSLTHSRLNSTAVAIWEGMGSTDAVQEVGDDVDGQGVS